MGEKGGRVASSDDARELQLRTKKKNKIFSFFFLCYFSLPSSGCTRHARQRRRAAALGVCAAWKSGAAWRVRELELGTRSCTAGFFFFFFFP